MFPEINKGEWPWELIAWLDGDYRISFFHTFPNRIRISFEYRWGEIRLNVYDKSFKCKEDIFLFKINYNDKDRI